MDNTNKRPAPPRPSADTTTTTKKARRGTGTQTSNKIKNSDFDALSQRLLLRAEHEYSCCISVLNPYPEEPEQELWASKSWMSACATRGVDIEFDPDFCKLVRNYNLIILCAFSHSHYQITIRGSHIRGAIKSASRIFTNQHFDIKAPNPTRKRQVRRLRNKIDKLTQNGSFTFKVGSLLTHETMKYLPH